MSGERIAGDGNRQARLGKVSYEDDDAWGWSYKKVEKMPKSGGSDKAMGILMEKAKIIHAQTSVDLISRFSRGFKGLRVLSWRNVGLWKKISITDASLITPLRYAVVLDTDIWNRDENVCGGEEVLLSYGTVPQDPDGTEN